MGFRARLRLKVIGARIKLFLMIMMANDIRGWMGPKFF